MRRLIWQSVVPLSLVVVVAVGQSAVLRADDETRTSHEGAGHAAEHDHSDEADHPAAEAGEGSHGDHDGGGAHHPDTTRPPIFPSEAMGELFVFSLVFFCLYLVVAKKIAWLPLIAGLDSREARVNRALAEAEAARIEAVRLLEDHQKHLDKVTEQVKEIIAGARTEAEQEKARIIAETEAETTAMRDKAIAEIHEAQQQSLEGLDERIEGQVATATEHVLG